MAISRAEAADALREVDQATARTQEMRAYRYASPHLILWGLLWAVGYGLSGLVRPDQWGLVWLPVDAVGVLGSIMIGFRSRTATAGRGGYPEAGKLAITLLFVGLFMAAVFVVFAPARPEPYLVFPGLLLGLIYVVAGIWKMQRLAWIGAAVFGLTLAGFAFLAPWLSFWMAAVGGGALVIGGLRLRKV